MISGELLVQPEKTTKVLDKFIDKEQIGNNGMWQWNGGENTTFNNPVYMLYSSTYETPVKSVVFNSEIINYKGYIKTDWDDFNVYK